MSNKLRKDLLKTQNIEKVFEYYLTSADQGNSQAQYNVGLCYENGDGIPRNIRKALEYYEKSADQGNAQGLYNLGLFYEYANGVTGDLKKSSWLL